MATEIDFPKYDELYVISDLHMGGGKPDFQILRETRRLAGFIRWVAEQQPGGQVALVLNGDVIAEIETDKATMEVEAVDEGTIAKILVPEGTQDVAVNDVIAVMAGDGEDVKAASAGAGTAPAPKAAEAPKPAVAPAPAAATPAPARTPTPPTTTKPPAATPTKAP